MPAFRTRRDFLRDLGISAAALPFVLNLPSLGFANQQARKQRLVVMFSPDGVVPWNFWPDEEGPDFMLKESLTPLQSLKHRMLTLHGVANRVNDLLDTEPEDFLTAAFSSNVAAGTGLGVTGENRGRRFTLGARMAF